MAQRVHDTKLYPAKASNGSTIIIYGHENGIGILWRGGRPLKKSAPPPKAPAKPPPKVNGTNDAIMIIDSDDEEPANASLPPAAEFEDEDEELDPDQPYPTIIQQLRLFLNTDVLHVTVPRLPSNSLPHFRETLPPIFSQKMVFAVACSDFSVRIITLPLNPPSDAAKEQPPGTKSPYGEEILKIPTHVGHQTIPTGVTMTWTSKSGPNDIHAEDDMDVDAGEAPPLSGRRSPRKKQGRSRSATRKDGDGYDLLVASHSGELGGLLKVWRFGLTDGSVEITSPISAYQTLMLQKPASKIIFNSALYPKARHSQLLIADVSGLARIYDPLAPRKRSSGGSLNGAFTALFRASFEDVPTKAQSKAAVPPILTVRKPIIDAAWALDGSCVIALLADGEWGIWDIEPTDKDLTTDLTAFSLRNFIGTSDNERVSSGASSPTSRNSRNGLVPMTPNTRRRKEETLFQANSPSSSPLRGGISVETLHHSNGSAAEDSLIIWYGTEVFRISDLAKFRSRHTSTNRTNPFAGPVLTQIHTISLSGESIIAVEQFETSEKESRMAVPRDTLLATEHRLIIATTTNEPASRDLIATSARGRKEDEETRRTDQVLLARGELDLGGMDRLLEDMEGSGSRSQALSNPRKVLFVSTS